ncbi:hypothetical protein NDK47_22635 [Brevibacillus ruminantium]|uniref:Aerobactin siderophore biosynthesis IucA/IucC-like C-terminal domain-containing protein n=1 Tax=Brevibacillus ruminantium TaxID=2950604 RepID=A0ABY4WCJ1_9BACL|nr:IucA/IucC family C-terminal-domain containing protein [Brevibacillus ruminantium]USG64890.1 hypothetical protein NDK47_22635 [Brevibacillus ruminantium]
MMEPDWNVAELEQKFRISFAEVAEAPLVFAAEGLLRKETSLMFLRQVGEHIGSPNSLVTASVFFKRLLALISGGLYAMSHHSVRLNLGLSNVTLTGAKNWNIPRFVLRDCAMTRSGENREEWREQVVRELFAGTVQPLVTALSTATGVQVHILWSHAAYLVHFYYRSWQESAPTAALQRQIADDFHYLTKGADPSVFGWTKGRPFDTAYSVIPHPTRPEESIQIRRQCCYQYRLEGGRCCYTCPLLNETERTGQIRAHGS